MRIQLNDPIEKKDDKKRSRPSGLESESKRHDKQSKRSKNVPTNCR